MIIFDLDGTLADCEHRRHFVDPRKDLNLRNIQYKDGTFDVHKVGNPTLYQFKPDWQAFYEACDKDEPIEETIYILKKMLENYTVKIWSGRCESVKDKTLNWLKENIEIYGHDISYFDSILKMRPIGDSTPDDQLKERWLDETIKDGKKIEFVFDDRPKEIRMWRKRGIFVFNCCQHDEEF